VNGWGGGGYNLTAGFTPDSREYVQCKYTNTNFIEGMYLCNRYKMTPLNERYVLITTLLLTNTYKCDIIHRMNIGIDFYGTIDTAENQFKRLVQDANMAGNTVYIISAIAYNNTDRLRSDARRFLGVAQLIPVYVRNYMEHPWAKLRTCRELGIDLMIDNRADTCKLLKENGIDSIVYTSWKGFVQQYDAKTHSNEY
jgi:hypothetical protein